MSRKILALVVVVAFAVGTTSVALAAKKAKCEVKSIEESMVTLDCGKSAKNLKVGSKVEVKKARKAIEGC